jgi:LysM repeat protein
MNKRTLRPLSYAALAMMLALPPVMASAQSDDTADNFEIIGLIEAATLNTLTINGQTYDITQAELDIPLTLGTAVKLEGSAINELVVVREVKALDEDSLQPGEIRIEGIVEALTVNGIQIAGQAIDLSTASVEPGVVVGERAELTLFMNENGQLILTHVEPPDDDDEQGDDDDGTGDQGGDNDDDDDNGGDDDGTDDQGGDNDDDNDNDDQGEDEDEDVKLVGTLDQIGADFIVLSGVTINTTGLTFENLVLGTVVKVEATFVNNGFVADEIEYEDTDDDNQGDDNDDQGEDDDDNDTIDIGSSCAIAVPAGWTTYVVTSGDSLSGLAARTGSSVEQLAQINCIANPSSLVTGITLAVPRTPDPRPVNVDNDDGTDDQGGDNDDDDGSDDQGGGNDDDGDDDHGGDDDDDNSGHGGGDNDDDD